MNERLEKIGKIMEDKAFVESILEMEDPVEVQNAFRKRGIDFSIAEINMIAQKAFGDENELTEEGLDEVAGGVLTEIAVVASGVALFANTMAEVNKARKEKGKSTIW